MTAPQARWAAPLGPAAALAIVTAAVLTTQGPGMARVGVAALTVASLVHLLAASRGRNAAWWLRVGAAAAAAVWLLSEPPLSDDVWRYLLDGAVSRRGYAPYAYAPASPKIAEWVAAVPGVINHPELPTIYPPVAQALFAVGTVGGLATWRALLCALVVAAMWVGDRAVPLRDEGLRGTAKAGGMARVRAGTFVATHPLVVVTAAGNGNVDAAAPLLVFAMLVAWARGGARAPWVAGAWAGAAAGVKLFPVALPLWWAGAVGRRASVAALAAAAAVLAASYLPLWPMGAKAFGSLGTYAAHWTYNASGHALVAAVGEQVARLVVGDGSFAVPGSAEVNAWTDRVAYYDGVATFTTWWDAAAAGAAAARAVGAAVLAAMTWRLAAPAWRRADAGSASRGSCADRDSAAHGVHQFARHGLLGVGVLFVVSPVVHPWYLCWLLPFAAAAPSAPALLWCGLVPLAFWAPAAVVDGAAWHDAVWTRVAIYGTPALAAAWAARPRCHGGGGGSISPTVT